MRVCARVHTQKNKCLFEKLVGCLKRKIWLRELNKHFFWTSQIFSCLKQMFWWIHEINLYLIKSAKTFGSINQFFCSPCCPYFIVEATKGLVIQLNRFLSACLRTCKIQKSIPVLFLEIVFWFFFNYFFLKISVVTCNFRIVVLQFFCAQMDKHWIAFGI